MSRGRAGPLHEQASMEHGKGMDWVMESWKLTCRSATGNGLPLLRVLRHFISVMIILFFCFVNSLFYVGWVHLINVSFPCNSIYLFVWTGLAYLRSQCFCYIWYKKFAFNLWYISHLKRKHMLLALYTLCLGSIIGIRAWLLNEN
jgi:hypothetical protein